MAGELGKNDTKQESDPNGSRLRKKKQKFADATETLMAHGRRAGI